MLWKAQKAQKSFEKASYQKLKSTKKTAEKARNFKSPNISKSSQRRWKCHENFKKASIKSSNIQPGKLKNSKKAKKAP